MKKNTILYIGQTASTSIGKLWLAVSDQGLVAIEQGISRNEFSAWLELAF